MKINYQLDANDFLLNQLYICNHSSRINKKRIKNNLLPCLIYGFLGIFCYISTSNVWALLRFFSLSFLWFLIYPIWERKHYIEHYQNFIYENYQARFNQTTSLEFGEDYLSLKDDY